MFCGYFKAVVLLVTRCHENDHNLAFLHCTKETHRKVPSCRKLRVIKEFNSEIKETCACSLKYSKVHP